MEKHEILYFRSLAHRALLQSNVRLEGVGTLEKNHLKFEFSGMLADVAWPLVTKFPHIDWVVKMREIGENKYIADQFFAFKEGKEAGRVGVAYSRKLGSTFALYSETISDERERGNFIRTQKIDVVLATVKKKFNPRSTQKMFQEAARSVFAILNKHGNNLENTKTNTKNSMVKDIFTRIEANPQIADVIAPFIAEWDMLKYDKACLEMRSLEDMRNIIEKADKRTALVLLDRGGYIVRSEEHVAIYNDETLPMEMRKSLGLLKLVQNDEQFIPDVGVRVNAHTFLVLVDET